MFSGSFSQYFEFFGLLNFVLINIPSTLGLFTAKFTLCISCVCGLSSLLPQSYTSLCVPSSWVKPFMLSLFSCLNDNQSVTVYLLRLRTTVSCTMCCFSCVKAQCVVGPAAASKITFWRDNLLPSRKQEISMVPPAREGC